MWRHGDRVSLQGPAEVSKVSCVSQVFAAGRRESTEDTCGGGKARGQKKTEMTNFLLPKFLLYKSLPYCPFYR